MGLLPLWHGYPAQFKPLIRNILYKVEFVGEPLIPLGHASILVNMYILVSY